jgi:predicted O-methyltransferase YrrM
VARPGRRRLGRRRRVAVRSALEAVSENEDLVATLLPVGDGLLAAVKR